MNVYIPTRRQRLRQAKEVKRKMAKALREQHAELHQAREALADTTIRLDRAIAMINALTVANHELRDGLSSWMDRREVSSDG